MRFSDFKIVETNARLQKRLNDWMSQYVTWQELKNQSTTTSMVGDKNITSPAFDKSMKDQKAQLDRKAEFFRQNGLQAEVDKFLNDMSKPMQMVDVDPVPGIARRKTKTNESIQLNEAARIDHAEDLVFLQGSQGAMRVVQALRNLEGESHKDVTVKWDGSPAIIFGRNENGEFILTDKSGFTAKGYDGKATSADNLQAMLMNRPGAKNPDAGKAADYKRFAANMKDIFDEYEKAVPKDYRGFFKGDLLYFNKPDIENGNYVFKPNIVKYSVSTQSDIGKKIGASKTGVVIHRQVDAEGNEGPLESTDIFQGKEVLVVPPISVERPADIPNEEINQLEAIIKRNSAGLDELLNPQELKAKQMTDFPKILYAYVNSKVDSSLDNLGADFAQWLEQRKQVSDRKKGKILEYVKQHAQAFATMWQTVSAIMKVKDDIIAQFDMHDQTVKQSIPGHGEGGEGYVLAHPEGDIKLVPREYFTKANRAVER